MYNGFSKSRMCESLKISVHTEKWGNHYLLISKWIEKCTRCYTFGRGLSCKVLFFLESRVATMVGQWLISVPSTKIKGKHTKGQYQYKTFILPSVILSVQERRQCFFTKAAVFTRSTCFTMGRCLFIG